MAKPLTDFEIQKLMELEQATANPLRNREQMAWELLMTWIKTDSQVIRALQERVVKECFALADQFIKQAEGKNS